MLEGGKFETIRDFAAWQTCQVEKAASEGVVYTALSGTLSTVAKSQETILDRGMVALSATELRCGEHVISLEAIWIFQQQILIYGTR